MNLIRRLLADRRAVAAVEIALLLPVLLVMCLAAADLVFEIENWYRLNNTTTQVGEIVSQCQAISTPADTDIFIADAQQVAAPLSITGAANNALSGAIIISALGVNSQGNVVLLWQVRSGSTQYSSSFVPQANGSISTGAYVLAPGWVMFGVEAFAKPNIWGLSGGLMGAPQSPLLYSQSMFLSRTVGGSAGSSSSSTTSVSTLQNSSSTGALCNP
jgi:Flp pilus assembly protein TadG